jgi:hypothetical protein
MPAKTEKKTVSSPLIVTAMVMAGAVGALYGAKLIDKAQTSYLQSIVNDPDATREYADTARLMLANRQAIARGETFPAAAPMIRNNQGEPDCIAMKFENEACRPAQVASLPASTSCVP